MRNRPKEHSQGGWLWVLALIVGGLGYGALYLLRQDQHDPDLEQKELWVIMLTVILSGLCVISATARLWFRR